MAIAAGLAPGLALLLPGCSPDASGPPSDPAPPVTTTTPTSQVSPGPDRFDVPIRGLTDAERALFVDGDRLFETPLRDADGLGPLYTRTSCGSCHVSGIRGPGGVQKMVVVLADGITPAADQSSLPFGNTVHPLFTGGGTRGIVAPPGVVNLKITTRVGPPIIGRGYLEAVLDSEIERVAQAQAARTDAIHGRINRVVYASEPNPDTRFHAPKKGDILIGRFGLKGRIATLDDFTADALQGDMGITSPLRPTEVINPDGLTDDLKPGVDVGIDSVNVRAMYVRLTAIPVRAAATAPAGAALFASIKCAACHVPTLKTRADYPIAALAGIEAPIYSDVLLHDMGDALADGIREGEATARDWRTAPLIGLRFAKTYLHDSRARSIDEAILLHDGPGSEAAESVSAYRGLTAQDREALLAFVRSL